MFITIAIIPTIILIAIIPIIILIAIIPIIILIAIIPIPTIIILIAIIPIPTIIPIAIIRPHYQKEKISRKIKLVFLLRKILRYQLKYAILSQNQLKLKILVIIVGDHGN
jgi:hypothetical protein